MSSATPKAIYVHIPFCARRCLYCDFVTFAGRDAEINPYMTALRRQITSSEYAGAPMKTVYIGGGTPSYIPRAELIALLHTLWNTFPLQPAAEVNVECNPSSAEAEIFPLLRDAGVTRISIGVQSLDDTVLGILGRTHSSDEARRAISAGLRAGFASVSADIMFAVPGQSGMSLQSTLSDLVELGVPHISAYSLSIEDDTPFAQMWRRGELSPVDEDEAADMYELVVDRLEAAGYERYEVSNFAKPGHRCRHNQVYWRNEPYLGFGAGAASYVDGVRSVAVGDPREFIRRVGAGLSVVQSSEHLTGARALGEAIMLALRTSDGADLSLLGQRYGTEHLPALRQPIEELTACGWLEQLAHRIRLTRQGFLLADTVVTRLMEKLE